MRIAMMRGLDVHVLEYSEIKLGRDTDQLDLEDTQNL